MDMQWCILTKKTKLNSTEVLLSILNERLKSYSILDFQAISANYPLLRLEASLVASEHEIPNVIYQTIHSIGVCAMQMKIRVDIEDLARRLRMFLEKADKDSKLFHLGVHCAWVIIMIQTHIDIMNGASSKNMDEHIATIRNLLNTLIEYTYLLLKKTNKKIKPDVFIDQFIIPEITPYFSKGKTNGKETQG